MSCVWPNKELKGDDVKLITGWKHVPYTIGQYFCSFSFVFLDESFVVNLYCLKYPSAWHACVFSKLGFDFSKK